MPAPISSTDCDDLRDLDLRDLRINVAECNKSGAASETGKSWELGSNGGKSEMWEVLSEGDSERGKIGPSLRDRLTLFYAKWDPPMLGRIDKVVEDYENDENALNEILRGKYGDDVAIARFFREVNSPADRTLPQARGLGSAHSVPQDAASSVNFILGGAIQSPVACRLSPRALPATPGTAEGRRDSGGAVPVFNADGSVNLTSCGALKVTDSVDIHGSTVVICVGWLFDEAPLSEIASEMIEAAVHAQLDRLRAPFVVLYLHTRVDSKCRAFSWLRRSHERMCSEQRTAMQSVLTLHPSLALKSSLWLLCEKPLWNKLLYCDRCEFLMDYISAAELKKCQLPQFVLEHDNELEQSPLMDYGIFPMAVLETPLDMSMT